MRKDITVAAQPRTARGKNEARRLRRNQLSPAVLYGCGMKPVPISVKPGDLHRILTSSSGHNTIFNLDVEGVGKAPVMIAGWQVDPITDRLLHADLLRVDLTKPLRVKIAVHLQGDPKGVKEQGGHLEVVTREIEVECLPDEIPEHLTVDVAPLLIGQSVRASDVPLSGSMKLLSHAEQVIAHVVGHKAEAAAPAPAEAAAAEPEVIKKGKKEAEGESEAGKKK